MAFSLQIALSIPSARGPDMTPLRYILILVTSALAACAVPQVHEDFNGLPADFDPKSFACCFDVEHHPVGLTKLGLAFAHLTGPFNDRADENEIRPGILTGDMTAIDRIVAVARPLDIVLMANKSYHWGRVMPGRFTHSGVYLGTEAELRRMGLWNTPEFVPLQEDIRAGRTVLEAVSPIVKVSKPSKIFQVDAVVVIRPLVSARERRQAMLTLASKVGEPFDFAFDQATTEDYNCTELINHGLPQLGFTIRHAYGRDMILPDDMAAQAIRGERLRVVEYIRGEPGGWRSLGMRGVATDVMAFWGPPPADSGQ
jgi:hypothetical protein